MRKTFRPSRTTAILVLLQVVAPHALSPAVIVVDDTCSLADAISAANADAPVGGCDAGSGADQLQLTQDVTLAAELPAIVSDITLEGGDFTVARDGAAPDFGIFLVAAGSFVLENTTVTNGRGASGGAIYADDAPVTIVNSTLTGNAATFGGGAVAGNGFGALTTIIESSLVDNSARVGGGVYGGWDARTTLSYTTVSGNSASAGGGGIYATEYGVVTVTNSTISGNSGNRGGGVYTTVYADVRLVNSTVSRNSNWNLYAGFKAFHNSIYVDRSIVAYPASGGNCSSYGGYVVGGAYNFDDDGSCPYASPITPGVDFDTTLADNGGPTLTHALLPGSVAADAAGDCGLPTDQRGFARDDGACDSGSFELGSCVLGVALRRDDLRRGEALRVDLSITHNRQRTVSVPFVLEVRDRRGRLVTDAETPAFTLRDGQTVRTSHALDLGGVPPGAYTLTVSMDEMRGGTEVKSVPFRVR